MARELVVRLIGDDASLHRSFVRSSKDAANFNRNLSRSARGVVAATVSFRGLGRALAFGSNAFIGGAGAVFAVKSFSEAASNMAEQTSKANVVFGASTRIVQNFANNALGLARDEALQTASTFGALLHPLGLTGDAAANASVKLTQLGIDFASFFNTDVTDALAAINSGLVGEVEPLRRYGVLLSQARVQQEALSESGKKSVKQLTNQEIVQARIALIFRDSSQAQGDFARTQGGLANQQRLLAQNVRNLEITLGQALNPTILDVTKRLNAWLSNTKNQQKVTEDLKDAVNLAIDVFKTVKTVIHDVDEVTGSFKNTMEILIGLKVASVIHGWTKALVGFEIAAGAGGGGGALGKTTTLGKRLQELARIGVLSIGFKFPGLGSALSRLPLLSGQLGKLALIRSISIPIVIAISAEFVGKKLGENLDFSPGALFKDLKDLGHGKVAKGPLLNWLLGNGFKSDKQPVKLEDTSLSATKGLGPHSAAALAKQVKAAIATAVEAADSATKRSGLTADQRNTFFDNAISRILERSGLGTIQQQISGLQKADALISERLKVTKDVTRRLRLEDELLQNQAQIKSLQGQQVAEKLQAQAEARQKALDALQARADARKARQFRELGLTATGDDPVAGVAALKRRLAQLSGNVKASSLNTPRLKAELARFRKVLAEGIVPRDVRSKITEMMDQISDQLKNGSKKITTKFRHTSANALLQGLGLDAETTRILRQRLAQVGVNGTVPGMRSPAFSAAGAGRNQGDVYLDGRKVGKIVTPHQRRDKQRRTESRRGPYAGRN